MTQSQSDTPDLQAMLSRIEAAFVGKLRYYDSGLHGLSHLREVALLAGEIAAESGADVESAMVAGFLHDCGRMNDNGGNLHAIDSAKLARPLLIELFPHIDTDKVCHAISTHADGLTTDDLLAGALWDADRLTLKRLGMIVREDLLSTPAAKQMLKKRIL
ncbi:MAG: HD domain-containing protein [Planctomycetaceae bacterium]|nr:MAG: HD domain-containing protein [Planctomycetaceae bacterium]